MQPQEDDRLILLKACIVIGVLVALISEGLSAIHQLDTPGIVALWILAAAGGILLIDPPAIPLRALYSQNRTVFLALAAITLLLGFLALWTAPNNYDSMTYRLPRILHWQQQKSLDTYATHILRQVYQPPFAEMCVLHLKALTGGDRLANLVQYLAMIGSLIGITHIGKLLRGSTRAQWIAALCAATIPMGILQATSTQNDYVLSFWLVCFVNFALMARERFDIQTALYAGASLGLGILTRQTAYMCALPFLLWLLCATWKQLRHSWKAVGVAAAVVILLNIGVYCRNWEAYGNPLGASEENPAYRFANDRHDVRALASGLTRSIGMHIGAFPSRWWRAKVLSAVASIHSMIGVDLNDPQLTWPETHFAPAFTMHEDNAGSFAHMILAIGALAMMFVSRLNLERETRIYAACVVAGFVLFCWMVRWSPDRARMHLAFFVLLIPYIGIVLDRIRVPVIPVLVLAGLVLQSLPFLLLNQSKPLIGAQSILSIDRQSQYFVNQPHLQVPYYRAAQALKSQNCREVGLILGGDDYEYPLWALTNFSVHFEHVAVRNYTSRYARPFTPCAIISRVPTTVDGFKVALVQEPVTVLVPTANSAR